MRLYSPEWIAAFNEAVAGLEPEPGASIRMLQIVHGGPDGTVRLALHVGDGGISLVVEPPATPEPQVTVSIDYEDAVALSSGEVDPAALLATGRVKVRGDLSVLISGQAILTEAAARLGPLSERTTF